MHDLIAPDLFLVEAAHALTRAQRQRRLTGGEVDHVMADLLTSLPQFLPYPPLLARAVGNSLQARHNVYVALAEREGCVVLTADDKMKRNQPGSPIVLLVPRP